MSLTTKDVKLFCKSFKCFSKLLILYPLVHPAAIHGLLTEFNYDYGFVMQLILKLEKQRNILYWDEVERVSQIMEGENIARIHSYSIASSTNQRLTQMMNNQMRNVINSYGESSNINAQNCLLMENEEQQYRHPKSIDQRVADILNDPMSFLNVDLRNAEMDLNEIMGIPEGAHQMPDSSSLYNYCDTSELFSDMSLTTTASTTAAVENNTNLLFAEMDKNPNVSHSLQTCSSSNIPNAQMIPKPRIENNETTYSKQAYNNNNKGVHELMETAEEPVIELPVHLSCTNFRVPPGAVVAVVPPTTTYLEHLLSLPNDHPQCFAFKPNYSVLLPKKVPNTIWRSTAIVGPSHKSVKQLEVDNEVKDVQANKSVASRLRQVRKPKKTQQQYVNTSSIGILDMTASQKSTNWNIVEMNLQTTSSQQQNNHPGPVNPITSVPQPTSVEISKTADTTSGPEVANSMSIPKQTFSESNYTNWKISEIMDHPKVQMIFLRAERSVNEAREAQKTKAKSSPVKPIPSKIPRKQKLKSPPVDNNFETHKTEVQVHKAVKRRRKTNINKRIKKLRTEDETLNPIAVEVISVPEIPVATTSKINTKRQKHKPRIITKKASAKGKEKLEIITDQLELENNGLQVSKISRKSKKQKPRKSNKMTEDQGDNDEHQIPKTPKNKKRKSIKSPPRRLPPKPNRPCKMFASNDPNITKIEMTREGQVITVDPNKFAKKRPGDPNTEVQFIRRFTRNQTRNIRKDWQEPVQSLRSASETSKAPNQQEKKPQPNRSAAGTSAQSQKPTKNQKGKGRARSKKNGDNNDPATKENIEPKDSNDSVVCCCQSVGFRKKFKLSPYDNDSSSDSSSISSIVSSSDTSSDSSSDSGSGSCSDSSFDDESTPKGDDPFDPDRETLFDYYERNPNADRDLKKYFMKKNKKLPPINKKLPLKNKKLSPTKTGVKRTYNTRSSEKEKNKKSKME